MARHDREDPHSLEEQLAWLDAIKENEEAPAGVVATAVDDTTASPYPKDPWLEAARETDPGALSRAAAAEAPPAAPSVPEAPKAPAVAAAPAAGSASGSVSVDDTAEEWKRAAEVTGHFTLPPAVTGGRSEGGETARNEGDEGFLAPLRPAPQEESGPQAGSSQEPGETGETSAASATGDHEFGATLPRRPGERGLFEPPERGAGSSGSSGSSGEQQEPAAPSSPPPAAAAEETARPGTAESTSPSLPSVFGNQTSPPGALRFPLSEEAQEPQAAPGAGEWNSWSPSSSSGSSNTSSPSLTPEWSASEPTAHEWSSTPSPSGGFTTPAEGFSVPPGGFSTPSGGFAAQSGSTGETAVPEATSPDTGDASDPAVRQPYQARRRHGKSSGETASASQTGPSFAAPTRPARRSSSSGLADLSGRPTADSLDPDSLLRGRRNGPSGGWRKLIYRASAGWIKPGEPAEVRRRRELITRARTPVASGHHRVAVLSLKGGVGKTTTTVGLGATLAQIRGDRVIAVDANPDRGTLSDKVELETAATVRDLLNERGQIKRYVDIRAFTSQAPSRLEILASDRDPSVSEAFSAGDYQAVAQVLENFYSICITDCGTGLLHSAMAGVLGLADQLVLVSSPSVDGARAASATLDWLEAHHYEDLVRNANVVLCSVRPRSKSTVDLDKLEAHFAARCRSVVRVPYDPHLEEGAEIDLERLQEGTRDAYLRLAASVGDGFAPVPAEAAY
ncbi:AAA family ATPase [Spongiactinospora sp. TRM90649]|uniref:MinD/ParA family ATP-binding protein n=1 Tax=Spongiactinospora sp. TRM90649 TaxID=3031114 RepID=UPI0023F8043C|nr:AAA family ATPase [Spongiactinospora sp. TRM90649]MDF5753010.1 AAA family ATPase [Spongiactinospora sp. TRM90649]